MAKIGSFKKVGREFHGEVVTLSVQAKDVRIIPDDDEANRFRVCVGLAEIGAAWSKTSGEEDVYLSVCLDDPSFAAPIHAKLIGALHGDSYLLVWTRDEEQQGLRS